MPALNFLLPLFVLLLVSGPVYAQDKPGNEKAVKKSTFSDSGGLETEQDPVDYRSGKTSKPKPPKIFQPQLPANLNIPKIPIEPLRLPVQTCHFPSVPRQADDIPAAAALPRLEAMVSETRAIKEKARKFLEKLKQDTANDQSPWVVQQFANYESDYNYIVQNTQIY